MPARLNLAPPLRSMANLAEDFFELRRRRFDRWLKELASGVDEEPSVRVFVMGGGSGRHNRDGRLDHGGYWRSAVGWRLPQTRWIRLYLHADGSLAAAPAAGSGAVDYAFDPHDPAPMVGGAISSGEPVMHAGAFDQSAAALRSDVLMFATAPLDRELEVTGPGTVRLWIASDAPDTDFTAKLIDVFRRAGTSARLPDEPDRGLVAGALSRQLGAAGTDGAGRGLSDHHRAVPDRQFVLPWATTCGSTSRAAISRILTSTRILASRKARGSSRASPATGSSPRAPDPRTSCCRSFRRVSEHPA